MDETRFFNELYKTYNQQGLEIIGIYFERFKSFDRNAKAVQRLSNDLGVEYTTLVAGLKSSETIDRVLYMLNHVMSYPTAIFIDREGNVRKIHTGFAGPGTSEYTQYVEKTTTLVEEMVK